MEFKPFALALSSLLLLSFLQSPQLTNAENKSLVNDFCNKSPHAAFCMKSFGSDPRAAKAKNDIDVATIVLGTASSTVKGYAKSVKQLMKTSSAKALATCAKNYETASESFDSALSEISEDAMTANYDAKVAGDSAKVCNAAMEEAKLQIPAIATKNANIKIFSGLAYAITDKLQASQ